jgi:glycosyltransferase involved in cell wall biosynthesis
MEITNNKILIVLPKLTCGGTERTAAELANYIAANGGSVTVLLMYREELFYDLHPNVKLIEPGDTRKKMGRILYIPFLMNYLRTNIKSEKPDVIFALGYIAYTLGASLGINCSVVISGRSSPTRVRYPGNKLLNTVYHWAHRALKKRVDGIIAQTRFAAEVYASKYSAPIRVIPNFLRNLTEHNLPKKNWIVTVGRCSFEKGQHSLIEAFSKLRATDWQLVIVGDGPKRAELEKQAKALGVGEGVIFAGFQQDVDLFLLQSKIFAFTSIIEGFPNALMEAMATPLACVSFDCEAGPSDLIRNGENGFLIEVGNIDQLVEKIQLLIDDEILRSAITQKASIAKEEYALHKVVNQYLDFFDQIVKGRVTNLI